MEFATEKVEDYFPEHDGEEGESLTFADALTRDPIAMVRSLVRGVRDYSASLQFTIWAKFCCIWGTFRFVHHLSAVNTFRTAWRPLR